jgi:phospholipase C
MLTLLLVGALAHSCMADSLQDVEHVVIFMQENRAFDHYFGNLNGVRGFNDRFTAPLPSGLNSFYQPTDQSNLEVYQLPWPIDSFDTSAMCMDAPEMGYEVDIRMWNNGHFDSWNTGRQPGTGMSYWTREGLPYYYTLYDNFAVGDQYFQSTFTATNPNRMFLFAGSNGPSTGAAPVLDNAEPRPGYNWTTVAELLEQQEVSWRVYQGIDNFDDNAFAWFANFQEARPGDALFDKGMARQPNPIEAFEADLASGSLPQVSWIIAPTDMSEHAAHHPAAGEAFTSRLLDKLKAHPEVYAKTAFILNYDEGGQFFDHAWTPTPPMNETDGVSTAGVEGEVNFDVHTEVPAPMGLGFRVPLVVISPWTRGNIVVSEVFDHTSVIQFLEERFGFECPTISPWRRAITGNLLSAFDFEHPDYSWPDLPSTENYVPEARENCDLPYPERPAEQTYPGQEPGTRVSRALPYTFNVADSVDAKEGAFTLQLANDGAAGAPFQMYDLQRPSAAVTVKKYAVEGGKSISDRLAFEGAYGFSLLGPNGFARQFMGNVSSADAACAQLSAKLTYDAEAGAVVLVAANADAGEHSLTLRDNAYGAFETAALVVPAGEEVSARFDVGAPEQGNWYDISAFVGSADSACFHRRFAGRMETGADTISDPAMAAAVKDAAVHREKHPELPAHFRRLRKSTGSSIQTAGHKDALWEFKAENL